MKNFVFVLFIAIIGLLGCNVEEQLSPKTKILVDLSQIDELKLSKIFNSKAEYIPLESQENYLIGDVNKLILTDSFIVIADYYNTVSVFIFRRTGEFVSQISSQGNGPYEYSTIQDFYFDEDKMEVGIFSIDGKLIIYDIEGNGIEQVSIGLYAVKYQLMGDKIFVSGLDSEYWLHVLSGNASEETKYIPIENRVGLEYGPYNCFSGTPDSVLFLPNFQQVFYCYVDGAIFPKYEVDFGEYNIPSNVFDAYPHFDEFVEYCQINNYAHIIDKFSETDRYLHFTYSWGRELCHTFYNRNTKEVTNAVKIDNDIDGLNYYGLKGSFKNCIVHTKWPYLIKDELRKRKDDCKTEEWNYLLEMNPELHEIAREAKDTDNPVVIIYSYK